MCTYEAHVVHLMYNLQLVPAYETAETEYIEVQIIKNFSTDHKYDSRSGDCAKSPTLY